MHPIQHILLPIDDSPGTQAAIDYAVLLANALGASITLVHVDELPHAMVGIVPGATVDGDLAAERRESSQRMTEIVTQLHATGFDRVTALHLTAPAVAPAVVDASRRYDLIVMGTHARTGVSRLVLGSVAEQVLRHATCPVLTVHLPPQT
jgi:nucleotide-binding universal stress UspA family protein